MTDDIDIRLCAPGDEELFGHIADEVFDDAIDREKLARYLDLPGHHLFVAIDNGVIVGQLTAVYYQHPESRPGDLYIDEVGVADTVRRRGIATRLMQAAFALGRELGGRDAWLGTEVENQEARAFYESLGERPQAVMYYSFRLQN